VIVLTQVQTSTALGSVVAQVLPGSSSNTSGVCTLGRQNKTVDSKGKCTKFAAMVLLMRPVPHSSGVPEEQRGSLKSKDIKNLQSYRWLNPVSVAYHFSRNNTFSKRNTPRLLQTSPA